MTTKEEILKMDADEITALVNKLETEAGNSSSAAAYYERKANDSRNVLAAIAAVLNASPDWTAYRNV